MKNFTLKLKFGLLIFILISTAQTGFSQVLISDSSGNPDESAMLEIKSTDKGMLIPRIDSAARVNISSPKGIIFRMLPVSGHVQIIMFICPVQPTMSV